MLVNQLGVAKRIDHYKQQQHNNNNDNNNNNNNNNSNNVEEKVVVIHRGRCNNKVYYRLSHDVIT